MVRFDTQKLYVHGGYVDATSNATFDAINPYNGNVIAKVQRASKEDVERAISSSEEGYKVWSTTSPVERSRILFKAVSILRERNDQLALLETFDTGKPYSETRYADIVTGADVVEYYAGLAASIQGDQIPLREKSFVYTRREPLGIIAGIGAWNYPIQIALWKAGPSLAAGNSMIFKPSEETSLTALKLAEIFTEAGVPDGVFNVLPGSGREVGTWLTEHPKIAKVSFTGGSITGKKVASSSTSSSMKHITMELGGKSPLIICDDANLDRAADIAMMANFYSSGQICTNGTRVFIPEDLKHQFETKILERIRRIRIGNPEDENINFGPLVSFSHMESVLKYIKIGIQEGARLLCGGSRLTENELAKGAFVAPTVFTDCTDGMTIVRDEIFGPVMSILSYKTEEEVILRANNSDFGLASGVVTNQLNRAHLIAHRLESGICWINSWGESGANMPVGGYKLSGIGRENGLSSLDQYTQVKSIQVELGDYTSVF